MIGWKEEGGVLRGRWREEDQSSSRGRMKQDNRWKQQCCLQLKGSYKGGEGHFVKVDGRPVSRAKSNQNDIQG